MSEMTQFVQNRLATSQVVLSSARIHGDSVARKVAKQLDDLGVKDVRAFIRSAAGRLEEDTRSLREAELALTAELSDDDPHRERRDASLAQARALLTQLREMLRRVDASLERYGLGSAPPRSAQALANYADNAAALLEDADAAYTDLFDNTLHTTALAARLREATAPLTEALADLERESRELQSARMERDRAVEAWEDSYQGVADILTGLYRFAGFSELAERVRPTARRATGEESVEAVEEETEAPEEG